MIPENLGRLERADLREAWESEASDFTPWLAQEANIILLGETIGIELEVEATEQNVGPFRADILCKDTTNGAWVLIENQLEKTDHAHLGQLLTYAAGLEAVTIVWISSSFTEEHRATLDWLNEITDDRFGFFGLEVELWRIGNSLLAPKFNVVSKPNTWTKMAHTTSPISPNGALQLEFWTALMGLVRDAGGPLKPRKVYPESFCDFAVGRSDFWLTAFLSIVQKRASASLVVGGPHRDWYFAELQSESAEIEKELGAAVEWDTKLKQRYVTVHFGEVDLTARERWPEYLQWFVETLTRFHKVFAPRVKALILEERRLDPNGVMSEELDQIQTSRT